MNYRAVLTMISLLLLGSRAFAAAAVRVQVAVPAGARAFYSLPGTPAAHPADGMVSLTVSPQVRGLFTFWATAPGCLPVFRHLDREALLRQAGDGRGKRFVVPPSGGPAGAGEGLALTPIPFDANVLDALVNRPKSYAIPPTQGDLHKETLTFSPDARGVAVSGTVHVMDPFRKIDRTETEVWWCPPLPAKAVRVACSFPPGETSLYFVSNLAISPDGEWLAYSQVQGMQEDLHLYNLFTGERRIVTADPRWSEYFPAWSPDGRQLAYIAEEEDGEGGPGGTAADRSVHLTRWDGQENRLVARQVSDVCPAFSPDGELLAYACKDSLKVCAWKSREHRKLITGVQPFGESSRALQWSPDGQWIAFVGVPVENGTYVPDYERLCFVYLVHRSGHPVRRLTRAQADLAWLPDNRLIINEIARWDTERGTHTGAVVVDVSGSVVQDLLVVSHESGVAEDGTTVPDYKREPWPASRLPLLPTLPGTAVSIVREGRNW